MILRLAARNLLRHGRRSLLMALTVVVSFALLIVFTGLADGAHEEMAEIGVRMGLGDVIVNAQGYSENASIERRIPDPAPILAAARALGPDVMAVAPRLRTEGVLQTGSNGIGVEVSGVDPAVEPSASKIPSSLVEGTILPVAASAIPPVLVGSALAESLGVRVGDRVTLTVHPVGGGPLTSGAFAVCGIFRTGVHDVDAAWVEAPLAAVQALTHAGTSVTTVALLLRSVRQTHDMRERLLGELSGRGVEVVPWQQAAPELYATIVLDEGGMYAMMIIVFVVVAAGIVNTILMSVLERTREFGVLVAIGAGPARVIRVVLTEAALLGLASLLVGLAVGLAANHYLTTTGLNLEAATGGSVETAGILLPKRVHADLSAMKVAWSFVAVFALVLVGAMYPALRAARLQPVEAIRDV